MKKNKITLKKGMTKADIDDQFANFVANQLIDMMQKEEGSAQHWSKKWEFSQGLPYRVDTADKEPYSGFNIMTLANSKLMNNYKSLAWGTSKAWGKKGFKLAPDQNWLLASEPVIFSNFKLIIKKDREGNIMKDSDGTELTYRSWFHKVSAVYNASQMINKETGERADQDARFKMVKINNDDNFKKEQYKKFGEFADNYLKNQKIELREGGDRAFYNISMDFIGMPDQESFINTKHASKEMNYYSTLFHEMGHSSGHESRLKRKFGNRFADSNYAFEELVAELTSVLLSAETGLELQPAMGHACYLNSWLDALNNDNKYIWKAMTKANQAVRFIRNSVEAQIENKEKHILKTA